MAKQKTLQFLRNDVVLTSKSEALDKLKAIFAEGSVGEKELKYGEPIICTFTDNDGNEKILLGIKGVDGYQIFEGITISESGDIEVPSYIQEAIDAAIQNLDTELTVNDGEVVIGITQNDGVITELKSATLSSINKTLNVNGLDMSVNVDGHTIVADAETGMLSVAPEALVQYVGSNTIIVGDAPLLGEDGNPVVDENGEPVYTDDKEISVKISSDDKVLEVADGLKATLTLDLVDVAASESVTAHKEIQLKGKNGEVIDSIDATDFLVDGMLDNVVLETVPKLDENGEPVLDENGEPIMLENLIFTFNTESGKESITVDLTKYIDIYQAGDGIVVNDKTISIKVKDEEKYLEVTTDGIATKGIDEAIEAAKTTVNDEVVDGEFVTGISKDEETGEITATHAKVLAEQVTLENVNDGVENSNIQLEATNVQAGIQELFNKMLDNEEVTAQAINKLIDVLGTSAKDIETDQVVYVAPTESAILADATSFTHADILLAEAIKTLQDNDVIDCGTY